MKNLTSLIILAAVMNPSGADPGPIRQPSIDTRQSYSISKLSKRQTDTDAALKAHSEKSAKDIATLVSRVIVLEQRLSASNHALDVSNAQLNDLRIRLKRIECANQTIPAPCD